MKHLIIIYLVLLGFGAKAQLPASTFNSRWFTGNTRASWILLDSPVVNPVLDTFYARYAGTQIVRIQGADTAFWFYGGNRRWFRNLLDRDTVSLSNRINLKLNIADTIGAWLVQSSRLVDTIYRVNDSTVGYTIKGNPYTFQILGSASGGGGGGSGTVTSVGLSMPSAFTVSGSPITTNGTLNVSGAGTALQYIRGNGTLATTDSGMIPNFYLKVRGLLTGSSPVTFNQTTGIIGINNANTTGTKGAATFSNSDFSDDGSGGISLINMIPAGSCTGCNLVYDVKGRIMIASSGAGGATDNTNIGAGFRPVNVSTQEMRTYFAGFGTRLDTASNADGITWSADTTRSTGLPTYFYVDSSVAAAGGGTDNTNLGSAFRWLNEGTQTIKTVANSNTILWDSSSTANSLTAKADTSVLATQFDLTQIISDTVFSHYVAYVDTLGSDVTGVVNNPGKSFATINGALAATASLFACTIAIGTGTFNSPDSALMRSNIWFKGSGMPVANDTVTVNAYYNNTIQAPTRLLGGTILRGSFIIPYNRENIHTTDFGVDVGSNWVTNFNGGVEVDGFLCAQLYSASGGLPSADGNHQLQINTKPRRGMLFRNIRVLLPSPSSPFHAFLIENSWNPSADNIFTSGGFAGVIIKTMFGIFTNLHTSNHGTYGIILKSNDYSFCYGVVVNGFECGPSTGNVGMGVTLDQGDPGSPGIYWCNVSNGFINHVGIGLSLTGDNMNISNITVLDVGVHGVMSSNLLKSNVSNITQRISPQQGYDIDPGSVIANGGTTWSNCTAFGNLGDGWRVHGGTALNQFENIYSGENTGYGFSTNGSAYIGNHTYYSNTAGATTGTIHNRVEITGLISAGSGISITGSGTDASPYSISASGGSQTWQQTLTTGSTLTGANTVTGGNNSFTWDGMFNFRVNANSFLLSKSTPGAIYSTSLIGASNLYEIGYTPVAATYSKGVGVAIDTNNNVGLGTTPATTLPLYATGLSTSVNGFQSGASNFYLVENITSSATANLLDYYFRIDATSGNITITLPAASTAFGTSMGIHYVFKRIDASGNTVTIARAGSDTIDGNTSFTLGTQWEVKELQCSSSSTWDLK